MKTWEERIAGASQALRLTTDQFESQLAASIGLTKENGVGDLDDDEVFKFGDFREAFKSYPIATLRKAFKHLREGKSQETESSADPRLEKLKALGLKVRIEDADTAILLPFYDATKPSDPVTNVLKKRFGDMKVVAFKEDGTVAQEETLRYMVDVEQGYPQAENGAIMVDGKLAQLWPIGVAPERMVEEDPLFHGRPLRNGCSIVNGRNWSKIDHVSRQFVRVIVDLGHINVENREAVLTLMDRAANKTLDQAYPEADLEFRKLAKKDALPKLRVELGSQSAKPNNPFGVPRRY